MKFTLAIESSNAAFTDDAAMEVSRILWEVRDALDKGEDSGVVRDINGNKVGSFELEE